MLLYQGGCRLKSAVFAFLLLIVPVITDAGTFDYGQLEPEHFLKLKHQSQFVDVSGDTFRIENTVTRRGLYIQQTINGQQRWRKHGVFYVFTRTGWLASKTTYAYGLKDGIEQTYNRKGVVKSETYYQKNHKHGPQTRYNDQGEKVSECLYEQGLKQGKQFDYRHGKLLFETEYVDGKRHGESLHYDVDSGRLYSRKMFRKGKQLGKTHWY